ncbi:hypothetical protein Tco_0316257 [Tanacetum coccineum]
MGLDTLAIPWKLIGQNQIKGYDKSQGNTTRRIKGSELKVWGTLSFPLTEETQGQDLGPSHSSINSGH